jgi:hypothetical protein
MQEVRKDLCKSSHQKQAAIFVGIGKESSKEARIDF